MRAGGRPAPEAVIRVGHGPQRRCLGGQSHRPWKGRPATSFPCLGGAGALSGRWRKTAPLDINSASVDELKALPGIGDAHAKRIVAARPYKQKDELVKKGILPQPTYDKIKEQIVARQK
jgi:hypothetical protein